MHRKPFAVALLSVLLLSALAAQLAFSQTGYTPSYTNSCALYGANSTYIGSWLYINVLVVILGISAVAMVYALSRLFPSRLQGRMLGVTRVEFTQLAISLGIIAVLLAFSVTACTMTQGMTSQYLTSSGSSSVANLDPFSYAEYYIGNLSLNTGIKLVTFLYAESIAYGIDAQVLSQISSDLNATNHRYITNIGTSTSPVTVTVSIGDELGIPYSTLATFYVGIFSAFISVAVGMLFLQWLSLPVIEAVAFTVLLPVALILRSVAYAGGRAGLRRSANAFLAIAIALYIIYPLTIALDTYIVHWIYTPCGAGVTTNCNPNYQYLGTALTIGTIPTTVFSTAASSATSSIKAIVQAPSSVTSLLGSILPTAIEAALEPTTVPAQAQYIIDTGSQFLFVSIVLFAFNVAITMVFAQSLTLALDAGIEGSSPFWEAV